MDLKRKCHRVNFANESLVSQNQENLRINSRNRSQDCISVLNSSFYGYYQTN